jgi:hypothetical protein
MEGRRVKLRFYFKCGKCGEKFFGLQATGWQYFPTDCPTCYIPLLPTLELPDKDNLDHHDGYPLTTKRRRMLRL